MLEHGNLMNVWTRGRFLAGHVATAPLLCLLLAASAAGQAGTSQKPVRDTAAGPTTNRVQNGDLERGDKNGPAGWQRPDGLTSFWVKDPLRTGKCLRFDTDVYKEEARARWAEMEQKNPPPPRPKTPTRGAKYNTAGGTNGVPFYCDPFPVTAGQAYRLDVDFLPGACGVEGKTIRETKVFVKGYVVHQGRNRVIFKIYKNCRGKAGAWTRNTLYFHPTDRTPLVKTVRVMLFPYWPAGEYYFDNIRITPVPLEEWKKDRDQVKPYEKARRESFEENQKKEDEGRRKKSGKNRKPREAGKDVGR